MSSFSGWCKLLRAHWYTSFQNQPLMGKDVNLIPVDCFHLFGKASNLQPLAAKVVPSVFSLSETAFHYLLSVLELHVAWAELGRDGALFTWWKGEQHHPFQKIQIRFCGCTEQRRIGSGLFSSILHHSSSFLPESRVGKRSAWHLACGLLTPSAAKEIFNFAQMLQGENVPASVAKLQEKIQEFGSWSALTCSVVSYITTIFDCRCGFGNEGKTNGLPHHSFGSFEVFGMKMMKRLNAEETRSSIAISFSFWALWVGWAAAVAPNSSPPGENC